MKSDREHVRQGTKRLAPDLLVAKARNCVRLMSGNPAFPDPTPTLAEVAAGADRLDTALQNYGYNNGKVERAERDSAITALRRQLLLLGYYVDRCADGRAEVIHSAGFDVKGKRGPSRPMDAPPDVRAVRTAYEGQLIVRWGAVRNRKLYRVLMTDTDPNDPAGWRTLLLGSDVQCTVDGLRSGHPYAFRVVAMGTLGDGPLSDLAIGRPY